ncbi:MAG TPA: GNAT family N-acetyltransferase [Acidimicrobiales bacterium]
MTATDRLTLAVALRPVTDDDREFLVGLYGSTRDEELSQVPWEPGQREWFVRMQFDAQDTAYRTQNPHGSFDVIELGQDPAGRLYVDRRADEIRIVDIALLPHVRGLGVGSHLIGLLQAEAAASGRILSIHVEVHNPAAELYNRLGFVAVSERGLYRRMEWRP